MKVFVSGPMSGFENYNFALFRTVEDDLRALGHEVISGRMLFEREAKKGIARTHAEYVRATLAFMLAFDVECICLLPGWEGSKGAKIEVAVGITLGLCFTDRFGNSLPTPDCVCIERRA